MNIHVEFLRVFYTVYRGMCNKYYTKASMSIRYFLSMALCNNRGIFHT